MTGKVEKNLEKVVNRIGVTSLTRRRKNYISILSSYFLCFIEFSTEFIFHLLCLSVLPSFSI